MLGGAVVTMLEDVVVPVLEMEVVEELTTAVNSSGPGAWKVSSRGSLQFTVSPVAQQDHNPVLALYTASVLEVLPMSVSPMRVDKVSL